MKETALAIGGVLVLSIVAAGASCWTVAILKLLASSRRLPQGLSDAAARLLLALGHQPQGPLVAWSPRRYVPWGLVDVSGVVFAFCIPLLIVALANWLGPPADKETREPTLADKQLNVWFDSAFKLGIITIAGLVIAMRTGAAWRDFGISARESWSDFKLGLAGFVMLAPPVYALQGLLVYYWKPSKHPLMEMFKESPDAAFFAVLFVAAAVVAPLFEELVFRVLLQGFLEKMFSFGGAVHELVLGRTRGPADAVTPPMLPPPGLGCGEADVLFISDQPHTNENPYLPPAIVGEVVMPVEPALHQDQAELRGAAAWLPIAISSLIFALLHYNHGPDWIPLSLLAAGMGYLYQRTHSLVPSLVVHALLNSLSMFGLWLQVFVLPDQGF